jgi:protein phosphatase
VLDAPKLCFDVASALNRGQRSSQEDAIISDFPIGDRMGVVVLADGMGGHEAGEVASKIVVTEVFSELRLQSGNLTVQSTVVPETLLSAAHSANTCLRDYIVRYPETKGMGSTLIALVRLNSSLFWISVGDSVLYLLRDGELRQLNEDHSLTPQIDFMVRQGLITEAAGRNHPDRGVLTSALQGAKIRQIDCPAKPLKLRDGDLIVAASDGLTFLERPRIQQILSDNADADSKTLSHLLLSAIKKLDHPEQDNICFSIIRVDAAHLARPRFNLSPKHGETSRSMPQDGSTRVPAMLQRGIQNGVRLFDKLCTLGSGLLR